jgi:hypothetical protein
LGNRTTNASPSISPRSGGVATKTISDTNGKRNPKEKLSVTEKNARRVLTPAGVARKWEGERRVRPPLANPPEPAKECVCLTHMIYDSFRGGANEIVIA